MKFLILAIICVCMVLIVWWLVHKNASEKFNLRPKIKIIAPSENSVFSLVPRTELPVEQPEYTDNAPSPTVGEPNGDFDPEFTTTREHMGAATAKHRGTAPLRFDAENLEPVDEIFDKPHVKTCKTTDTSVIALLHSDVMGLDVSDEPSVEDCTYISSNGNLYKEPCELSDF